MTSVSILAPFHGSIPGFALDMEALTETTPSFFPDLTNLLTNSGLMPFFKENFAVLLDDVPEFFANRKIAGNSLTSTIRGQSFEITPAIIRDALQLLPATAPMPEVSDAEVMETVHFVGSTEKDLKIGCMPGLESTMSTLVMCCII